ncbi:MAG: histidine kinase [Lachnospiraceae bacterium]|jgi:two-component system sensor histidine kinase YesM|nr:histidine kinase [Lachnospiraceae bacterium]MDD3617469.1 histidine kinase [Lachnospiraceae bacterium]
MKKRYPSKLQSRFFLAYLSISISILVIFSIFFYQYVSNILLEQSKGSITDLNNSFMEQTENILEDMDSVSINITYSSAIKDLLGNNTLLITQQSLPAFSNLVVSINGAENKADQINLFDYNGNCMMVGISTKYSRVELADYPWVEDTKITGGSKILSAPYQSRSMSNNVSGSDWFISLYRSYYNASGRDVGAIEVMKRCKSIFKNIITYKKKNPSELGTYVYNQDGQLLYPYGTNDSYYDYYSVLDSNSSDITFHNPESNRSELIAYESSPFSGWTYVTVQPESAVLQPVRNLVKLLLGVCLVMILGIILISFHMSKSLMRPIRQLQQEVKDIEIGNLDQISAHPLAHSFEELEELNQTFQKMRKDLKLSMDDLLETRQQEVKSRTLALQSQINPHFYYNTLASVIVLAEDNQSEEVIKLCRNLTNIMRYITDTSVMTVTIKEEMDYIQRYLYCMKVRYQSSLNYMVDIDPDLLNEKIPKLVIQPLVENAIKYGTNKIPPWGIAVHGKIYKDYWQIDVMDSGDGFTEESLELIHKRIEAASKHLGMPDIQLNGMGTLNVYLRWKLFCGDDMIFELGNTEDGHGMVSIGRRFTSTDNNSKEN